MSIPPSALVSTETPAPAEPNPASNNADPTVLPTSTDANATTIDPSMVGQPVPIPKKAGNKGNFHGERRAFLESWQDHVSEYHSSGAKHKRGSGKSIYDKCMPAYWARFPPGLPLELDPPVNPAGLAQYRTPPTEATALAA
uniref:Uncharacterized protein n=1 Tax=Mycena chlorophos TaxID=658473 RepID=A0ABQ0L2P7_MYCCL|nr:predicted protein [Mycena chlorophos]